MIYNRVVPVGLRAYWWRGRPRFYRYEATFYNSAYGSGSVSAFTRRKCDQRFRQLVGEFMAEG